MEAYKTMSKAIRAAGRPMVFSLCEWGQHKPWRWAKNVGHLWRTTGDIGLGFEKNISKGGWTALSVLSILDQQDSIRQYAGPGHWNDPDMLEVGNGMKPNDDKAHFSLWCMLAAPLMAGNDLRKMSDQTRETLTNKDVISLDQDPLGVEAFRFYAFDGIEIWVKPLSNNELAVCFLNRSGRPQQVHYSWKEHPITDTVSNTSFDFMQNSYKLHDLWEKKDLGSTAKTFDQTIPADDVVVLKLTKE